MPKFLVSVDGKLVVTADDKESAKTIVKGILAAKQPWLIVSYNEPVPIADADSAVTAEVVASLE